MHTKFKILMLVRHGQSTGNVDQPTHDHASIPLTALGEEQAKKLSARIDVRPNLIVVSSFRRAQQTAEPLREKFPDVPVEIWPDTAEFTYLSPARCRGTRRTERLPWVKAYWQKQDPRYCDGAGAETFHDLVTRANARPAARRGAAGGAGHALSHGQFISCLLDIARHPYATDGERMAIFRSLPELENTGLVYLLLPQHE